ncbi:MAG TPA: AMP-binding protein [Planctomycetota bacterium]|nr:AMP-binding protein [Planctomycetota bacterium]
MLDRVYLLIHDGVRGGPRNAARLVRHLPRWLVRRVARARLTHLLRYVWRRSPAQRERWHRAGVRRRHLRSPDVLARIPFTTSDDLARRPEDFACVPERDLIHLIGTSGTTGHAKKLGLTERDLDHQTRLFASKLHQLPGASRVLAVFIVDSPTWSTGWYVRRGVEKAGMFGLLAANDCDTSFLIDLIREYDIDTLITTPTTMHRMTLEARCDLRALGLRYALLSAQPWSEAFRAEMESAWHVTALDAYGMNELGGSIAAECPHKTGLHISDVDFHVEIVDPETGAPLEAGREGEVVVTTLARRGMPLVRYRTGDLARLFDEDHRCPCGVPLSTMSRIRGRLDDMLILGPGTNVYPDEFDRAILSVRGVSDYQLVVEKDAWRDVLSLTVEADEPIETLRQPLLDALMGIPYLRDACWKTRTLVVGGMEALGRGTLSEGRPKSVRFIDRR